jgi:MerR family transcriptional regulator, redox-sensitive transcriptional activator SoxR
MKSPSEAAGFAPMLSVGEVARCSGVAVSALHFYEAKGLTESVRSTGDQRRYPRGVLRRVAFIRVAQRAGISLAHIAAALDTLPARRMPDRADWVRLSRSWRADLDQRIAQLRKLRDTLDDCVGCGCLPIDRCRLRNPLDTLAVQGPGARRLLLASTQPMHRSDESRPTRLRRTRRSKV